MKVKWFSLGTFKNQYYLLIEGALTIKNIYKSFPELFYNKGLLIINTDCNPKEFFPLMQSELSINKINFEVIDNFFWIDAQHVNKLFAESVFGDSLDSCYFLNKMPSLGPDMNKPRKKGILKINYSIGREEFTENHAEDDDIFLSYEDIPDLLIVSKNEDIILNIKNTISTQIQI